MDETERKSFRGALGQPRVAVIIPCYNEAISIRKVVTDFRFVLPDAKIYVYDNNSTDDTRRIALESGAEVRREPLQGKGNVVRRAFADVEAEVYVLVDGDDTYDATAAPDLLSTLISERLDMVVGKRVTDIDAAYRPGHRLGNLLLTGIVRFLFGNRVTDMLSGYRVFSRRFVRSFPALSSGFEIETELTIHALDLMMPVGEVPTQYKDRPSGSVSKLNTYVDGLRILLTILVLVRDERPLQFFAVWASVFLIAGLLIGTPVVSDFLATGLVPRFPSAILAAALVMMAFLSLVCGLILDSVSRGRKELKRMVYLSMRASPEPEA